MARIPFVYVLAAVFTALLSSSIAYAAGYGTSSITLNPSSGSVMAGQSVSVSYSVNLASGGTWGTSLQVSNQQSLSAQGINVTLSKAYADPPYSGTAEISTGASTAAGTYTITFLATGDDPSASPSNYTLTVSSAATTATTSVATTTMATTSTPTNTSNKTSTVPATTSAPTTSVGYTSTPLGTSPPYRSSTAALALSILAVIVMVVVIVVSILRTR